MRIGQRETRANRRSADRALGMARAVLTVAVFSVAAGIGLATATLPAEAAGEPAAAAAVPILGRNTGVSRGQAASAPRSEGDQAIVDGWPLYRTERGQAAYNATMATLKASEGQPPDAAAFKDCPALVCNLKLPAIGSDGWIPAGRIWVSPTEYVLVAHSPRMRGTSAHRRHALRSMRYFVFHEFHNSSRNTDPYDTISSHSGAVFVPFYLSKPATDARGHRFVAVIQVAPYDIVSVHATNFDSAGPGVEVAKNVTDSLAPLQGTAGILLATIVKAAAPNLRVVNHGGNEGLPMLTAYEARLAALRGQAATRPVGLPIAAADAERVASASGHHGEVIAGALASARIPVADRRIVPRQEPRQAVAVSVPATLVAAGEPRLIGPIRLAVRPEKAEGEPTLVGPITLARRPSAVSTSSTR